MRAIWNVHADCIWPAGRNFPTPALTDCKKLFPNLSESKKYLNFDPNDTNQPKFVKVSHEYKRRNLRHVTRSHSDQKIHIRCKSEKIDKNLIRYLNFPILVHLRWTKDHVVQYVRARRRAHQQRWNSVVLLQKKFPRRWNAARWGRTYCPTSMSGCGRVSLVTMNAVTRAWQQLDAIPFARCNDLWENK